MKKTILKVGVLVGALAATLGFTTTSQASVSPEVLSITESTPLFLDQAPSFDAESVNILAMHYSHSSHQSHVSHASHVSHYSSY